MKAALVLLLASIACSTAMAGKVRGYVKRDGTYVAPHVRTNLNGTQRDNYGTKGNYNPYTGATGTKEATK